MSLGGKLDLSRDDDTTKGTTIQDASTPATDTTNSLDHPKGVTGQLRRILLHTLLCVLPMLALSVFFLVLVVPFNTRIPHLDDDDAKGYFQIRNVGIPVLLTLTTVSALLSICLIPSLLTLTSFLHAHDWLRSSEYKDIADLPTPLELALLIRLVNGSLSAYVQTIKHCFIKRNRAPRMLRRAVFFSTLLFLLSLLVVACDLCLHAGSRAVDIPVPGTGGNATDLYGRVLSSDCYGDSNLTLDYDGCQGRRDLDYDEEAKATATDKSALNKIVNVAPHDPLQGFHNVPLSLLVDARAHSSNNIFVATTFGVASYFENIGERCDLNSSVFSWNCEDHHFSGSLADKAVEIPETANILLKDNEVKWVIAAKAVERNGTFSALAPNTTVRVTPDGGTVFTVDHCETAVYRVTYLYEGGRYTVLRATPADEATTRLIIGPAFPGMVPNYPGFGRDILANMIHDESAKGGAVLSVDGLADTWAPLFSKVALSSAVGIVKEAPTDTGPKPLHIVSAIPKAALLLLWALDFLYVLISLALGFAAARNCLSNAGTRDVQARMGTTGALARGFGGNLGMPVARVEDLLPTGEKVGVARTPEGGWGYESVPPQGITGVDGRMA
ncbi:hypothetical protein EJ06DRAFT_526391 [Trichodelitschia bisporula]|uniref:Uncharacterized protein n=1 Tax=Trichodelitschia bisporula TaxID=703511 RepID=A0A6G1I8B4_9PEZI|nr:hypothetical protein EJ06DRAFT_526391 [Trichodelitschia bisporula]